MESSRSLLGKSLKYLYDMLVLNKKRLRELGLVTLDKGMMKDLTYIKLYKYLM